VRVSWCEDPRLPVASGWSPFASCGGFAQKAGMVRVRRMAALISPNSPIIVAVSEKRWEGQKPGVESQRIQQFNEQLNGLLAVDSL
jgi:hypothetical protein